MTKVGLFPNLSKKNSTGIVRNIVHWLLENKFDVLLPEEAAKVIDMPDLSKGFEDPLKDVDLAVTLGGDGTLLNVARRLAPYGVPILGINIGHLGFLTEVELSDLYVDLERLKSKKYFIDTRMMIEANVIREGRQLAGFLALNDVVVTKGPFARLVRLKTTANGAYIDTYPSDGLIISTPTGSTAYSLSAGGPIINPNVEVLLLTPICPHTLQSRSIVLSKDDIIKVQVVAENPDIMLTVDGQQGYKLLPGDEVVVKKSDCYTKLIRLKNRSFYDVLRKKLTESSLND
ncbi:NAD(+)/NADH kinase [Thermoanaerobacterium sp. DL9XJH110]|jgi:NAD+ kinase|uniref:NAD(+)/NADH kinase n=1 Tax=Thermoanaerobacterium sp. DL9XJH110 TaxID=3386643 RepID=UPI003BB76CBF